jgi:hypothetical protein
MTRKNIIEQIKRSYYGGLPSEDHDLTDNEVNIYLNQAAAQLTVASMRGSIEIDGVESLADGFYATFKNIDILKDTDTNLYYMTLPQVPVGVKRGHGISSVFFPTGAGVSNQPMEVSPREVEYMDMLRLPNNKIFWWTEGDRMWFKSNVNLLGKKGIVRMVSTSGGLDDTLYLPPEFITQAVASVSEMLRVRKGMPKDLANDGIDNN